MAPRLTILVVDDDADTREMLFAALARDGVIVVAADNGEAALTYLREHRDRPPALILIDLLMPGMDGFTLAAQARMSGYYGPVLLMSAGYGESPMPEFPFVPKPLDLKALRAQISCLVQDEHGDG